MAVLLYTNVVYADLEIRMTLQPQSQIVMVVYAAGNRKLLSSSNPRTGLEDDNQ